MRTATTAMMAAHLSRALAIWMVVTAASSSHSRVERLALAPLSALRWEAGRWMYSGRCALKAVPAPRSPLVLPTMRTPGYSTRAPASASTTIHPSQAAAPRATGLREPWAEAVAGQIRWASRSTVLYSNFSVITATTSPTAKWSGTLPFREARRSSSAATLATGQNSRRVTLCAVERALYRSPPW